MRRSATAEPDRVPQGVTEAISVDMGCVGDGLQLHRAAGVHLREGLRRPLQLRGGRRAHRRGPPRAGRLSPWMSIPHYGSDVEATLGPRDYDIRHGLIGAGVYASHGYERSHIDGVMNTLKVLKGFLHI